MPRSPLGTTDTGYRRAASGRVERASEVRSEEPCGAVADPLGERPAVDVLQRDRGRACAALVETSGELADETRVADFDGELEVEAQASGIEVPRADDGAIVVDDEQFRVHERSGLIVDVHAEQQKLPEHVPRRPMHV